MSDIPSPVQATLRSPQFMVASLLIWLLSGILYLNITKQQTQQLQAEADLRNGTIINIATSYVAPLLQTRNVISLNVFLKNLVSQPDIYAGKVVDSVGQTVTEYVDTHAEGLSLNQAIHFDSQLIGYIQLEVKPVVDTSYLALTLFLWTLLVQVAWGLFSMQYRIRTLQQWQRLNSHLQPLFGARHHDPVSWDAELSDSGQASMSAFGLLTQRLTADQIRLLNTDPDLAASQFHTAIVLHCAPATDALAPRSIEAHQLQADLLQLENWITHVAELYQGHRVDNGLYLVFGLADEDSDEAAVNALCAARVLYFLSRGQQSLSISLAAGSFWSCPGTAPWPLIRAQGPVLDDLDYVHLHNDGEFILLTESLFQYAVLNERLQASIYRDVITADGRRLEVWQLDGLQGQYDNLLLTQAEKLRNLDPLKE